MPTRRVGCGAAATAIEEDAREARGVGAEVRSKLSARKPSRRQLCTRVGILTAFHCDSAASHG